MEALPVNIDFSSIRVSGEGDFIILSVNHAINLKMLPEHLDEIEVLKDSLLFFKNRIDAEQAILEVYQAEKSMIFEHFKPLADQNIPLKVDEISAMADFMRSRLKDIKLEQLEIQKNIAKDQEEYNRVNRMLSKKQDLYGKPRGEVHIQVNAPAPAKGRLKILYNTRQAGWEPVYDIRAGDPDKPIDLQMKANAYQNTGEDWENVNLTFSTGLPYVSGQRPSLATWFLRFQPKHPPATRRPAMERSAPAGNDYFLIDAEEEMLSDAVEVSETMTTVEYVVSRPWNITSGRDKQLVDLKSCRIPASFGYHSIPKLNNKAFLIAKIDKWQDYKLLPGKANLFFEDTYVGESYIDPVVVSDTLELSFGHDAGIIIERERLTEYTGRSLLGGKKTKTIAWEISLRNNKKQDINLVIFDQMPVSTHRDIEIDILNYSGADLDKRTGLLKWHFKLKPAQTEKFDFRYSVTYPRDKQLILE